MSDSEIEIEEDENLKAFMPKGFGKQDRVANTNAQIEQSRREPLSKAKVERNSDGTSSEDDSDSSEDSDAEDEFPVSHELVIKTHEKAVTSATLDPSGSRLITGSNDCTINFHDFSSMTSTTIRAFKSFDPTVSKTTSNNEVHPIHQVLFNPISPSSVLVVTSLPQAKIVNRDGDAVATFVKGDMYLRDMHNTKGHISELTSGAWHPSNKDICVTAGTDSTLRIWDINSPRSQRDVIVHRSKAAGSAGRTRMTAVAWGGSSNVLVGAAYDGSLAMWGGDGPFNRPSGEIRDAHTNGTWTSGIAISSDGRLVISRGGDDLIKLWDTRKFTKPVNTAAHASTSSQFPSSNICFAPNSASVITGSATGHLHILNPATLRPELVTPVTPGSTLITVLWHERLNQIITGSANAETHVLYDPNTSQGGAKVVMTNAPKRRHIDDDPNLTMDLAHGISGDAITTASQAPASSFAARHPNVGMTNTGRSRDPRRPHVPQTTPFGKSQPDKDQVTKNIPLSSMRDEDPREALLKYSEKAEKDRMFTNAWAKTQPKTIYAELSDDEEEPEKKKTKR